MILNDFFIFPNQLLLYYVGGLVGLGFQHDIRTRYQILLSQFFNPISDVGKRNKHPTFRTKWFLLDEATQVITTLPKSCIIEIPCAFYVPFFVSIYEYWYQVPRLYGMGRRRLYYTHTRFFSKDACYDVGSTFFRQKKKNLSDRGGGVPAL